MREILRVATFVTLSCLVYGQGESCITPTSVDGLCISLHNCSVLHIFLNGKPEDREKLKQWHCGYIRDIPMVCCPSSKSPLLNTSTRRTTTITTTTATTTTIKSIPPEDKCLTLEGTTGRCVKLSDCKSISKRLEKPKKEDLEYAQRSRCFGPAQYSVCCGLNTNEEPLERYSQNKCSNISGLPDPDSNCCGKDSSSGNKIIGGVTALIDEYPWLVLIEYSSRPYLCGGSLISNEYVLTAAHCVVNQNKIPLEATSVRVGEYNTTNNGADCVEVAGGGEDCTLGAISISIASTTVHPEYNAQANIVQANDIAIIKLSKAAPYNDFVRPICLPQSDISRAPPPDLRFYVAGWGAVDEIRSTSDIKLYVDLPYVDGKLCQQLYSQKKKSIVWDKQICAGGEFDKDTCKGDSGGPLMYLNNEKYELTGITSFGLLQCGNKGKPSVYTNVYDYLPWIKSVVNS